jgi:aryl sulfotransferase
MPKLIRPALREVRSRIFDSARWAHYAPRPDDIVIATYSKCGTTWMQRIVQMLVFQSAAPRPVWDSSPWPDMRLFGPIEETLAQAEAQTHRRFFKSHLPFDALPVYEGMKFIHVARDGRDAAMSLHNHLANFTAAGDEMLNAVSRADPKFGDEVPHTTADPRAFFHDWVAGDANEMGDPGASFFHVEKSFWAERKSPNVLLVHYNDLKADRGAEMRRLADFLGIRIDTALWPKLIEAASFETMKSQADTLVPQAQGLWDGGGSRFLYKGTNGRWQDVVSREDLQRYDAIVAREFSPSLARWVAGGRRVAGDPRALD